MASQIRWSPRAASDFEEICKYIARDSHYYALLFAKKVNAIVKGIPHFPKAGRVVPEYKEIYGKRFIRTTGSFIGSRGIS